MTPLQYDVIVVGTGFASTFFLSALLKKARPHDRILVLERGQHDTHAWQIQQRRNSSTPAEQTFVNTNPAKKWWYTPSFGGGSNCWWAVTPRMMPNDFKLKSIYGVGVDWPVSYDDLEEYYYQVEVTMAVSGPDDASPYPRSRPYPQLPHRFNDPDKLLKAAYPNQFFHLPTARARVATAKRPPCCASGVCDLCPINAKFTILNEMAELYQDPRVTLMLRSTVHTIETAGNRATGVTFSSGDRLSSAQGDLIILGANALFNPHILMRSKLDHPLLGKRLHEQVSVRVTADLDQVDNFQGSTSMTGLGYMLYDGPHRSQYAAGLLETYNIPYLRMERGKWRRWMILKVVFEDLPSEQNYVTVHAADPTLPETIYVGHSDYTQRAIDRLPEALEVLLKPLPVERIWVSQQVEATEFHIQGTTLMGNDPQDSIVDKYLIHHQIRNLVVLGSSVFPTGSAGKSDADPFGTIVMVSRSLAKLGVQIKGLQAMLRKFSRRSFFRSMGTIIAATAVLGCESSGAGPADLPERDTVLTNPRSSMIVQLLRDEFRYLDLHQIDLEAFAHEFQAKADRKILTMWESNPEDFAYTLKTQFLMSTDFFRNGADETRPLKYLSYFDLYNGCQSPFAQLA